MSPRLKDFLSRGGCGPCPECEGPHLRCTPLHSPEQVVRLGSCSHLWALRPMPRVTFSPMRKSPKNLPEGGHPLWVLPLGGPSEKCFTFRSRSPCGKPHPLDRAFSYKKRPICHFEMSGQIGLFFSPRFTGVTLSAVNPWRGGFAPRMPRAFLPTTNTARAQGRGIKGGYAPFAGGPGTRRSLAYLCLLSLREKVGRGAGRSARSLRVEARSDDLLPGGTAPSHRQAGVQGGAPTYHGAQGPPLLQKALGDASPP